MGKFLARIGVIETPECWWCKEPVQSVEHLSKCRRWRKGRRRLVRELEKEGVSWQVQVERRWLAGLLANEKTATKLFKSNRSKKERRSKREGGRMGARKRPSRRRSAWIDSGGDNPKAAVIHSGKTKQKWINRGQTPG